MEQGDVQLVVGIALALVAAVMMLSGVEPVSAPIAVLVLAVVLIATSRRTPLM